MLGPFVLLLNGPVQLLLVLYPGLLFLLYFFELFPFLQLGGIDLFFSLLFGQSDLFFLVFFGFGQDFLGRFLIPFLYGLNRFQFRVPLIFGQFDLGFGRIVGQFNGGFSRVFSLRNLHLGFIFSQLFLLLELVLSLLDKLFSGGLVNVLAVIDGCYFGIPCGLGGIDLFGLLVGGRFDGGFFGILSGFNRLVAFVFGRIDGIVSGFFSRLALFVGAILVALQLVGQLLFFLTTG